MDCEKTWVNALERGEFMPYNKLIELFESTRQILLREPNIIEIEGDITVVSCIRGNFRSLLHVLKTAGSASKTRYLFIGGYIGREPLSLECLLLVLALKELYPHQITLLRGCDIEYDYYIRKELDTRAKYTKDEIEHILLGLATVVSAMPLAAVVNKIIYCTHGGLVPDLDLLDDIIALDRSDPNTWEQVLNIVSGYADPDQTGWGLGNSGAGYTYGHDIFEKFMKDNYLEEIIAARIRDLEGIHYSFNNKLLELFSAAEYIGLGNKGSFIQIFLEEDGNCTKNIVTYSTSDMK